MKSKYIIYPAILLFTFIVPVLRYYSSTPEVNACVQDYISNLQYSDNKGYIYKINGRNHIEPANSSLNKSLGKYLVGRSYGCMMYSGDLLNDLNNTVYCSITYIIQKSPIHPKAKQPLAIYKAP